MSQPWDAVLNLWNASLLFDLRQVDFIARNVKGEVVSMYDRRSSSDRQEMKTDSKKVYFG